MSATSATAGRWRAAESKPISPPVLFVIDDDAGVMSALRDDLSRRFGTDFRVVAESSAAAGLAVLRELADGHEPVALLIVDYHLSGMTGVDFLARAHAMHPLESELRDSRHSRIPAGSGEPVLSRNRTAGGR